MIQSLKEEILQLSDHLKDLTDGERTILWQALTIDVLSHMLQNDDDELDLVFGVATLGDEARYYSCAIRYPHPAQSHNTHRASCQWDGGQVDANGQSRATSARQMPRAVQRTAFKQRQHQDA